MYKVILILDKFFLKYEGRGANLTRPAPPGKTILKKPSLIGVNVSYVTKMNIYPAYISKHILNFEKQIILLMVPHGEGWHCLALKKWSTLWRKITSKHDSYFHCLSCLHLFRTKSNPELHKRICNNKNFCGIVIPSEETKILEFNQYQISDEKLSIVYADLQSLIKN